MKRLLHFILLLAMLPGCARAISDQNRRLVEPGLTFAAIRADPMAWAGRNALLGGKIAAVRNTNGGGTLEIVQFELDDSGVPIVDGRSGGRFLAVSTESLDGQIYLPGRLITLVGEVKGKKSIPLDEVDYSYPVLAIREVFLWKPTGADPQLFIMAPYYDPYYFAPQTTPYWYRQFAPTTPPLRR